MAQAARTTTNAARPRLRKPRADKNDGGAAKPSSKAATAPSSKTAMTISAGTALSVRHYCLGFGDCHLLSFPRPGDRPFYMLIDCGNHPSLGDGGQAIAKAVADIAAVTGKQLDVLVISHEHMDHLSGFDPDDRLFQDFTIGEVWFGWTEDPDDPLAFELDLFKAQGGQALAMASDRLSSLSPDDPMQDLRMPLQEMSGFYASSKGKVIRPFRENARSLAKTRVRHLKPGGEPLTLDGVDKIRVYVLGPPRDPAALSIEERTSELYKFGGSGMSRTGMAISALALSAGDDVDDMGAPFDPEHGHDLAPLLKRDKTASKPSKALAELLDDHYLDAKVPNSRLRRIDGDWLGMAADLALQLDRGINNTSLVLAFELPGDRIVVFPGDAQVGNWLSWPSVSFGTGETRVTGADLMARTVYLKIAHHGSHNGTLRANGLERMTHADLSAFIPAKKEAAEKLRWKKIPFEPMLDILKARTAGRVIQADSSWISEGKPPSGLTTGSIKAISCGPDGLFVQVDLA